eukprot:SAG11_NODE_12_length_27025_cov_37.402681_14_plen_83_part_00
MFAFDLGIIVQRDAAAGRKRIGGEAVVVKLGRQGKKSYEGSLAMFAVCCAVGYVRTHTDDSVTCITLLTLFLHFPSSVSYSC